MFVLTQLDRLDGEQAKKMLIGSDKQGLLQKRHSKERATRVKRAKPAQILAVRVAF
jgi:hypothetical protein